jgi:hypothetical protein
VEGTYNKADLYQGVLSQDPIDWAMVDRLLALANENARAGYPQNLDHLRETGHQLWRMYLGLPYTLYPLSSTYAAAADVVWDGHCWEDIMAYYAPTSPWRYRGEEVARQLLPYGYEWEFALAALFAESSWGCNTSAVAFGNAPNIPRYIDLIRTYPAPNDIDSFVNEWHMPENIEKFRTDFGWMVRAFRTWEPNE